MILLDANLLIYAHVASMPQHDASRSWLDEQLNGTAQVGIPWASALAFLRIVTNSRVFAAPASMRDAWSQVKAWLDCDVVWTPQPGERHAEVLERIVVQPGIRAELVPDAHLAALAIEHGLVLCSSDGDFARFPELHWYNPLRHP